MTRTALKDITVEVTNRCQLHCRACGIWREKTRHEISAALFVRLMGALLEEYRLGYVSVTGGEPLLHPGLARILHFLALLKARGRLAGFGLYTSGADSGRIRKLFGPGGESLRGAEVGVSIDGDARTHDCLRGRGVYEGAVRSLEYLSSRGSFFSGVEIKFTINRQNYSQLRNVYALARRLGVRFSPKLMEHGVLAYYHRAKTADAGCLSVLTPPMRRAAAGQLRDILRARQGGVDEVVVGMLLRLLEAGTEAITGCMTPQNSLFINSRKDVYPCLYMPPTGRFGSDGRLAQAHARLKRELARAAKAGHCPRCLAYHGFLKSYNAGFLL